MTRNIAIRIGVWIALLVLLFLTAVSLIKYATWSAIVSGDYGLASQPSLVSHAGRLSKLWLTGLVTEEIVATVILFALLPARLRLLRLFIPVLAVPIVTGAIAWALIILGHGLH
ncbi:MAG: hypothetical protein WA399_07560 [Acidobacteriaceae bacterium]